MNAVVTPLLRLEELRTWIATDGDPVRAVDGVSLELGRGKALGLVGESGSGKSLLARSVLGLLPQGAASSGRVVFEGDDLLALPEARRQALWGNRIAMVFQDAGRALNPVLRVGRQMREGMVRHLGITRQEADERAAKLLAEVGVPDPARRLGNYPHELSGGMRQRVMIAMALSCEPDLLIADEPTTALDVTVQRQILDLLAEVRRAREMALILISHDLGVVAGRTDSVAVMYAGRVVEQGPTDALFDAPRHRYTEALLASTPSLDAPLGARMRVISGALPDPRRPPDGCRFWPRCASASDPCSAPAAETFTSVASGGADGHRHACLNPVVYGDELAGVGVDGGRDR
jgi:peptide/nickel transport system ATP-binding protein